MKHFRSFAAAIAVAGLCGLAPAQAETKTVRVVYPPVGDMWPYFVAKKDGIFAKNGLEVKPQTLATSSNAPAAIVSGSTDIAVLTLATLLPAIENGLDLVVIAGGTIADDNLFCDIMVKPDSNIKSPKDLEGKKVGVPGIGAFVDILLQEWYSKNGVDVKKVNNIEVPFPQMLDVLRAGTVDAITPVEPFISRVRATNTGVSKFSFIKDLGKPYRVLVTVTTREYAQKNPDVIKALRASLAEAEKIYKADFEKIRASVGEFIKMPPQALAALKLAGSPATVTDAEVEEWVAMMTKHGHLKTKIEASKINWK